MRLAAEAPLWLALILALLLVAAAIEDAVRLRISNIICILILGAAFVAIAVAGPQSALWQNIVVFGALLGMGTLLFASGKLGGGDVKLLASAGLWFDIRSGVVMLTSVLLAGGVLALVILGLRMFNWSDAAIARVRLLKPKGGIPYGVAIASGVLLATAMLRG
ncbi:prepilin peptidase [Sphingomonas sp.]|uniref:A24 family peptidase n=1 Tax=Sphingomonas sp. TaxID=28214 RepID=UPI00286C069C|nr:prepilin peptidase [Sphingomonas sp.]